MARRPHSERSRAGIVAAGVILAMAESALAADGGRWTKEFVEPWFDGNVDVVSTWRGDPVIAGDFRSLAGRPLGSPALWDGEHWRTLGGGVDGTIHVIYDEPGGDLWIGGDFTHAGGIEVNGIAWWDGEWHAAGDGFDGVVHEITRWQGGVAAVGDFPAADPEDSRNLAFWDGVAWSGVEGDRLDGGAVLAAREFGGRLILGGTFPNGIASWDNGAWAVPGGWALGPCVGTGNPVVHDMDVSSNGWLYIAGSFRAPTEQARNIARLVANGWTTVGTEFDDCRTISDIHFYNGHLWAVAEGHLWTLRTEGWVEVDAGPFTRVNMVADTGGELLVGGDRSWAGDVTRLDHSDSWSYARADRASGFDGAVYCLADWGGAAVAAGSFLAVERMPFSRIARRNGTSWEPLGDGLNNTVHTLAVHQGGLVAGGAFNGSGSGTLARRVACWDGTGWETLGAGFTDGAVTRLLSAGDELLAIGTFTATAGVPLRGVAAWNGSVWAPKGSTVLGLNDLAEVNGELLVAGTGSLPDGGDYLGRWDGADWASFPAPPDRAVRVVGTFRGDLVIGGDFLEVGGVTARRLARWDGVTWWPLGSGANARVDRLLEYGGQLYAAGNFSVVGGRSAARVARWDGTEWWPLGSGVDGVALAFLPREDRLWVAGGFHRADGYAVPRIATWTQPVAGTAPDPGPAIVRAAGPAPIVLRAWPNPAVGSAEQAIEFSLPARTDVTLTVHDVAGRLVRTVSARGLPAGRGQARWDGRDDSGRRVAAGVYFVRLAAAGESVTHKIVRVD